MPSSTGQLRSELLHPQIFNDQQWAASEPTDPPEWLCPASHITGFNPARPNPRSKIFKLETDLLVAGRWKTQLLLGAGSFGHVYQALDTATGQDVAVKVEHASHNNSTLRNEYSVYNAVADDKFPRGFATMLYFENLGDHKCALVMQRFGRSLDDIRAAQPEGRLPVLQVVQVGVQCLHSLERLHALGFIHCDVKPKNILAGVREENNTYFLVDFGLAARLPSPQRHQVQSTEGHGFVGTSLYASVNVHDDGAVSKRCDLESLAYSLAELVAGRLPWRGSDGIKMSKWERRRATAQQKREASAEELFGGWGKGFEDFFEEIRALRYDECPNYDQLRYHLLKEQSRCT